MLLYIQTDNTMSYLIPLIAGVAVAIVAWLFLRHRRSKMNGAGSDTADEAENKTSTDGDAKNSDNNTDR